MLMAVSFDTHEKFYRATDIMQILEEQVEDREFYPICQRLAEIPTAIVRCKDCEHWQQFGNDVFGNCGFGHGVTDEQFYCRDGEREEE